jgi:hypothetical protein
VGADVRLEGMTAADGKRPPNPCWPGGRLVVVDQSVSAGPFPSESNSASACLRAAS